MMRGRKAIQPICFFMLMLLVVPAMAQTDYTKQFFNAKTLFREGKYNLAMESFKPLIPYDKSNPFSEYASFYYALSAYRQGYKAVAKDQLTQLKTLHGTWDKMDDVNLWIGTIHMDNKDFFQGLKVWNGIGDKQIQKDIVPPMKTKYLSTLTDIETLRMMLEEYPKDEIIAQALARQLSKNLTDPAGKTQLESLIQKFNLKRTDYFPETPKTFYKDNYSVSVLFPFMANTLEPNLNRKRNQIVLDLYEGMKLAVDTLAKQGVKLSLRAYDTERNSEKIKKILATEELKNTDLIVGPIFQDESKLVLDFSRTNKINVFNPISNNSDFIGVNPYAYLFEPSFETLGKKSADFLSSYVKRKNCIVFYGGSKNDSILAMNFVQRANENNFKIKAQHRIRTDVARIINILATPTEYDEFKFPKQFTIPKDSIGSIFVASDDALIYAKVASAVETRADSVVILGSENWMAESVIDLDKYQTLGIVLHAPKFTPLGNAHYKAFERKFIRTHGRMPNTAARTGYEFLLFAGQQLKKNGVYFQEAMSEAGPLPGYITSGFNFQGAHDNQLVPFIKFIQGQPAVIGKR